MNPENFINNGGGFAWFTGVIEDIDDPMEMGRYRVRCYGYHNADKTTEKGIPTEDLPWAMTMLPVTSASMSGVGQSATGLLRGTWVIGFFRDGINAQDPVIMGSIPSITSTVDYQSGFTDPSERYPSENKLNTPDTPVSAQVKEEKYKKGFSYTKKDLLRKDYEAGHIVEFDVTPGKERISTIHRTGTYTEVTPIGDKTEVIVGKNYRVVAKGENVYIEGGCNLTIDGGCNTRIIGDWNVQVTGNKTEHIGGKHVHKVKLDQEIDITGAATEKIGKTLYQSTGQACTEAYGGNQTTTAPNIFLN